MRLVPVGQLRGQAGDGVGNMGQEGGSVTGRSAANIRFPPHSVFLG